MCTDARIVFQPIIDLASWTVVAAEALARFDDDASPLARLAEAEKAGTRQQLELAFIRLALDAAELLPEGLFITLNASGTTMLDDSLEAMLVTTSRSWGLELTEASTTASLGAIHERVSHLGGMLLVDDAGSASADEGRIRSLQPDVVKIDTALFWQLRTDDRARDRLLVLTEATRATGARLLVEGVEDAADVELARDLGAELAQGYYLGMPTPAAQMRAMLQELHRSIGMNAPGL